jgi:hypothetical protein
MTLYARADPSEKQTTIVARPIHYFPGLLVFLEAAQPKKTLLLPRDA